MIIQCKNCSRKFSVKDSDIPVSGRKVQCGNCSTTWFQMPVLELNESSIEPTSKIQKSKKKIRKVKTKPNQNENLSIENSIEASNGKYYKFLGSQWAELLPSGKAGKLATKKIAQELNELAQNENASKSIDPSTANFPEKKARKGMGFFTFLFLLIIVFLALIGVAKTFEQQLLMNFPQSEYLFEKGEYIFESMENIITIVKDLINSY